MNLLDYVLLGVVVISVVMAALQGFVYEVWMMGATLAALALATWKYGAVALWFGTLGSAEARNFAGFVVIVAVVMLAAMIAGRLMRGMVHAVGLGGMDRLLGAGLGLVRGVLLGVALVFMLTAYPFQPQLVRRSRLAPDFLWGSRAWAAIMPRNLSARFETGLHAGMAEIGKEWQ